MPTAGSSLKSYKMPYDSMEPTIPTGSDLVGDRSYYSKHEPKRWDVVVFSAPKGYKEGSYIKRIVGLPGEIIHLTPAGIRINGDIVSVPPTLKKRLSSFGNDPKHKFGNEPYKIPADSVFVIGDNFEIYVADSREFGPISIRSLEARVLASITAMT